MKGENLSSEEMDAVLNGDKIPVKETVDNAEGDQDFIKKSMDALQAQKDNAMQKYDSPMQAMDAIDSANYMEIVGLPSKGSLYPKNTKLVGRALKVIEVKKLSALTEENADYIINDIISRTIKGINVDDILVSDKLYLIFWLRANTYRDSGYTVGFHCDKCETDSSYHFELDNLEVNFLREDYNPNNEITLQNGDRVLLKQLRVKDEKIVDRFKEMNSESIRDIDDELLTVSQMIQTVNGSEVGLLTKYNYILDLAPGDFSYISSYMDKFSMGVKPYVNAVCKKCGGTAPCAVSFRADFFFPKYQID